MPTRSLALLLLTLVPAASRAAEPPDPRERGDLAVRARAILRKHCGECHGEKPTRGRFSVLDHRQVTADRTPVRYVAPGEPNDSRLIETIEDGAMPPGGRSRLTKEEVDTLRAWVVAKAPSYPAAFDDRYALAAVLDDLDRQKWDGPLPFRYVSFAHLADAGSPDLRAAEPRLRDALLAASGKPIVPQPVDDAATVFRLDLRATGWLTPDLFDRMEGPKPAGVYRAVPFDLVLLEYPLPFAAPKSDRLDRFLEAAGQLRPVPYLRGDWLADILRKDGPLAAEMRSLTELAAKPGADVPGPVPRPFAGAKPVRNSPPPLGAWYSSDVATDPLPFISTVMLMDPEGKLLPELVPELPADGRFQIFINAKADASFAVVRVPADGEVRLQAIDVTRLKANQDGRVKTDTGRPFVPLPILSGAATATEHILVFMTDRELPELTVIRSRHTEDPTTNRYPIYRVVPAGKGDTYDPARVIRKVIPLKVVKPAGAK
jgi:mono/diheme cytochrome c family protein